MDLPDFLLARIAEDEAVAQAAGGDDWPIEYETHYGVSGRYLLGYELVNSCGDNIFDPAEGEHIARHDPARVLAECEAKRRVVAICQVPDPHTAEEAGDGCTECMVLYTLALPYADHPDYDEAWRP